jgi:hypothetical protein
VAGNVSVTSAASRRYAMNVRPNSTTTSRRRLTPRERIETMPTSGLDEDGRSPITSLSAHRVSPTTTGLGSVMSDQPRFAVAFSLVSATLNPTTRATVSVLLTSGRPYLVPAANSLLKCTWFVFIVKQVNQMLSVSVSVRPRRLR